MARRDNNGRRSKRSSRRRSPLLDVVALILPILCLGAALYSSVWVFRRVNNTVVAAEKQLEAAEQQATAETKPEPAYGGVQDPWIGAGTFTVGNEELDHQIKNFCDSHTSQGDTATDAAKATYTAIAESAYLDQVEKPSGRDWVSRSAKQYFNSLQQGGVYQGDYYEFASVTALCLRYFGFSDAIAVPVLYDMQNGGQYGSALCLVSDVDRQGKVCDPSLGADGWMLDRTGYNILVDDIGQNLDAAEGLGLKIQRKDANTNETDPSGLGYGGTSTDGTGYGTDYGYGNDYGYDTGTTTNSTYGTGTSTGTGMGTGTGMSTGSGTGSTTGYDSYEYV